jgi:acyl-CoA thioester hydrolase
MAPHSTRIKVRFAELDPYAHVNHAVYVTYFEVGRAEALESIGLSLESMAGQGFQFVITELAVRYRRAAEAGDELTVETMVSEVGRASTRWTQRIRRGDEVLVTAEVRAGITDRTGRPTKPPAWLFEALAPLRA